MVSIVLISHIILSANQTFLCKVYLIITHEYQSIRAQRSRHVHELQSRSGIEDQESVLDVRLKARISWPYVSGLAVKTNSYRYTGCLEGD